MTPAAPLESWVRAFDAAAGRGPRAGVPADLTALATRLVAWGRVLAAEEACPTRWVRRAETLFARPTSVGARLLALVSDTWALPASATRGGRGRRYVRLSDGDAQLEAEIGEPTSSGVPVRGTLEGLATGSTGATILAFTGASGRGVAGTGVARAGRRATVRAAVREGGVFELVLPERVPSFRLEVRAGRRTLARTPMLATRPPGAPRTTPPHTTPSGDPRAD